MRKLVFCTDFRRKKGKQNTLVTYIKGRLFTEKRTNVPDLYICLILTLYFLKLLYLDMQMFPEKGFFAGFS